MTVQNEDYRMDYNGDGVQTAFPVTFYFLDDTHLEVILVQSTGDEVIQILNTDYTVIGSGVPSGGSIEMVTPPAADERLVVIRSVPVTQLLDYVENDNFPAESHEGGLDKLTMIVQQQQEELDRAITVSPGYPIAIDLPPPVARKGLKWDDVGQNLINSTNDLDTQQEQAAASASAAATSESNAASSASNASGSASNAATSASNALNSENKANRWAEEDEDVEVEPGKYSAKHWAAKSQPGNFVSNSNGNPTINDLAFDVDANIGASWESIGPTGSGADNIWTVLNSVPAGVDWIEVRFVVLLRHTAGPAGSSVFYQLHTRRTGSSEVSGLDNTVVFLASTTNTGGDADNSAVVLVKIPVDSSRRFDLIKSLSDFTFSELNSMYLTGWGFNQP